jgi:hypothetical protein
MMINVTVHHIGRDASGLTDSGDVFAAPGSNSIFDVVLSDGRSAINGLTLEEIQARERNPAIVRMPFDDWRAQAAARQQAAPLRWLRTDRHTYMRMLEVLPPIAWDGAAFCVGEPYDHCFATGRARYMAYRMLGDDGGYQVTSRPVTVAELKAIK